MRSKILSAVLIIMISTGIAAPSFGADAPPSAPRKFKKTRLTRDESESAADHRKLLLTTGADKAVDLDFDVAGKDAIAIGNPKVVVPTLVTMGGKYQIVFRPTGAGDTTVSVRDPTGELKVVFHVRVTGSNILTIASELRNLLRDVEGLVIRVVGTKVVVEGETLVPSDYARVLAVIRDKAYADYILNLMILSPLTMQLLAKKIQDDINLFAPNVKTRVVNGRIFLEGTVDSGDVAARAATIATLYLPDPRPGDPLLPLDKDAKKLEGKAANLIQNFILVNPPAPKKAEKLVRVTVHLVELSKDYSRVFGFQWRPGFTSGSDQVTIGSGQAGGVQGGGASFSATISSLFPKLKSAQDAGYARILNTGTFVVRSGQPAKLSQVTEIPYLVQTGQNAASNKAEVGLEVAATPLIVGQSEDIQLDLDIYQGEVVAQGSAASGGAPMVAKHKINTKLYVKSNESAAVAAVNSSRVKTVFNKDTPGGGFGGQTEELFNLTRSKGYTKTKSQFVIFVTPQIIDNASEGTEDLRKNFRVKVK